MKRKILINVFIILLIIGIIILYRTLVPEEYVKKNDRASVSSNDWKSTIANSVNQSTIIANAETSQLKSTVNGIYMSDRLSLMIPVNQIRDTFDCAVSSYLDGVIVVQRGNNVIKFVLDSGYYNINDEQKEITTPVTLKDKELYIPADVLCSSFGLNYKFDMNSNQAEITNVNSDLRSIPYRYSYEETGRAPTPRSQGSLSTCWAFASLTAIESALLPQENMDLSVDHMTMANSFDLNHVEGGDYTMSMAYLLAWQGPVLEQDDPYGDGVTDRELKPVKHVQEIQVIEQKDFETIKKMIFKYGGVQSSFYASSLSGKTGTTKYYNRDTNSYCYIGDEKPNHDIVIIGWDDNYPKENFNIELEGNGAFICRNSWGSDFGDNGDFYISYYDTNIGVHNTVYTKIENIDNYDNIYQSDLCGFVGQLGYNNSTAYFANAYTSKQDESIKAIGFYATGIDTEYSIYICENFSDATSLESRSDPIISGTFKNSGFYTVNLEKYVNVKAGQKFAVIVRIKTPNSDRPVAVEFANDVQTENVDLTDGEGYVSSKGVNWDNTESKHACNVCLKVYTDNK